MELGQKCCVKVHRLAREQAEKKQVCPDETRLPSFRKAIPRVCAGLNPAACAEECGSPAAVALIEALRPRNRMENAPVGGTNSSVPHVWAGKNACSRF